MALSPPKASRAGLRARQAAKRDTTASTVIHSDGDGLHPLDSSDSVWRSYLQHRSHSQHYGTWLSCCAVKRTPGRTLRSRPDHRLLRLYAPKLGADCFDVR